MTLKIGSYPVIRNLPDGYYPVIGRIIVDWSYLENLLRDGVYMLLRLSRKEGRIAVRSPRASEIASMIEELMTVHSFSTKVNMKELKKVLVQVAAARDALAHGVWVDHAETEVPVIQVVSGSYAIEPGKPSVKARVNPIAMAATPSELQVTVRDIARLIEVAEVLRNEIAAQAGPLPGTPQTQ